MKNAKRPFILTAVTVLASVIFVLNARPARAITAPLVSFSGRVWHDPYVSETHKVDGIQDAGEPGMVDVVAKRGDNKAPVPSAMSVYMTPNSGYVAPTGVELISFQYEAMVLGVRMAWTVRLSDGDVPGFRVWRAVTGGRWKRLTPDWLGWDRINGNEASYSYEDTTVYPGTSYDYKLESEDGTFFGPWQIDVPEVDDGGGTVASRHVFMPFLSR